MIKVSINDNDEFLIKRDKEAELRKWLEENSEMVIEETAEDKLGDDEFDEFYIEISDEEKINSTEGSKF